MIYVPIADWLLYELCTNSLPLPSACQTKLDLEQIITYRAVELKFGHPKILKWARCDLLRRWAALFVFLEQFFNYLIWTTVVVFVAEQNFHLLLDKSELHRANRKKADKVINWKYHRSFPLTFDLYLVGCVNRIANHRHTIPSSAFLTSTQITKPAHLILVSMPNYCTRIAHEIINKTISILLFHQSSEIYKIWNCWSIKLYVRIELFFSSASEFPENSIESFFFKQNQSIIKSNMQISGSLCA